MRVYRVRKLLELQSKLVKTFTTPVLFLQRYPRQSQASAFHLLLGSFVSNWLDLFFSREGSPFSCTYSPFTKSSVPNWWHFPFRPGWGFVYERSIKCTFCRRVPDWITVVFVSSRVDLRTTVCRGNRAWAGWWKGMTPKLPPASAWL